MKKILMMALPGLLFSACGNNNAPVGGDSKAASAQVADMHDASNSLDYQGTYVGTFPAADCPGIATTLTLKNDGTFDMRSVFIDRDSAFDDKGTYAVAGNLLTLDTQDGEKQYYRVEENRLRRLDMDKQEITGVLADNYILQKEN